MKTTRPIRLRRHPHPDHPDDERFASMRVDGTGEDAVDYVARTGGTIVGKRTIIEGEVYEWDVEYEVGD